MDGIAHVVNLDLPQVPEDFIHRAGRTGRAGATGVASIFATRQQRTDIGRLEKSIKLKLNRHTVPAEVEREVVVLQPKPQPQPTPAAKAFRPRRRFAR